MGFFDAIIQNMNLPDAMRQGVDISQRTNSFRLMQAQFDLDKKLKEQQAALAQKEYQMQIEELNRKAKDAAMKTQIFNTITSGLQSAQNKAATKKAKTPGELAQVPGQLAGNYRTGDMKGLPVTAPPVDLTDPIALLGLQAQAGQIGNTGLSNQLGDLVNRAMPPTQYEQSQINRNNRETTYNPSSIEVILSKRAKILKAQGKTQQEIDQDYMDNSSRFLGETPKEGAKPQPKAVGMMEIMSTAKQLQEMAFNRGEDLSEEEAIKRAKTYLGVTDSGSGGNMGLTDDELKLFGD